MGRDWLSLMTKLAFGGLVLALLTLLAMIFLPFVMGGSLPTMLQAILPVMAMGILVLSLLVIWAAWLLSMYEIATAKNDSTWKALWLLVVFFLGIIGLGIYQFAGRKERKI